MLLVISLAAGPLLLIVPSVNADKIKPPEVMLKIIWEDEFGDVNERWLIYEVEYDYYSEPYDLPPGSELLAKTETYTIELLQQSEFGKIEVYLLLPKRYYGNLDKLYTETFAIVHYGLPADYNDDGIVNGQDIHLISNAINNPNPEYRWEYDLFFDGVIDNLDVNKANTYKQYDGPFWDEILVSGEDVEPIDHYGQVFYYVSAHAEYFSGWGIRR
jgi:hypothetical protein